MSTAEIVSKVIEPITKYLNDGVNELMINEPGSAWVERNGKTIELPDEQLSLVRLQGISQQIATYAGQELGERKPILSASLPSGERVQIIIPGALEPGKIAFAIRKPSTMVLSLDVLASKGFFNQAKGTTGGVSEEDLQLQQILRSGNLTEFLKGAIQTHKNIIISGGTSSGKTTFANALVEHIDLHERIITIEDTREARLPHKNKLHLLATNEPNKAPFVTFNDALKACLRLNPTRILMSEIRGTEAFDFLEAINSGHPGAITTMHASSPLKAVERLCLMVLRSGVNLTQQQVTNYVMASIDVIVQCENVNGQRRVTDVFYDPERQSLTKK